MRKFVRKEYIFEAMQCTKDNLQEVKNIFGEEGFVYEGDWVTKDSAGNIMTMPSLGSCEELHSNKELVTDIELAVDQSCLDTICESGLTVGETLNKIVKG